MTRVRGMKNLLVQSLIDVTVDLRRTVRIVKEFHKRGFGYTWVRNMWSPDTIGGENPLAIRALFYCTCFLELGDDDAAYLSLLLVASITPRDSSSPPC